MQEVLSDCSSQFWIWIHLFNWSERIIAYRLLRSEKVEILYKTSPLTIQPKYFPPIPEDKIAKVKIAVDPDLSVSKVYW